MKKALLSVALLAAPAAGGTVTKDNTDFAFALHGRLAAQKGNLFYSPYSISSALAMTYAGAKGETAAEMAKALRFRLERPGLDAAFKAANDSLNGLGKGGAVKLSVANALWGEKTVPLRKEFLDECMKYFGGGLYPVDFKGAAEAARGAINAWVERRTAGKIKDLIPSGALTKETRLVLTNAVYFKGDWAKQFKKEATRPLPFTREDGSKATVPLMFRNASFQYAEFPGLQALELPYKGDGLSMLVLLPSESDGLPALEKKLSTQALGEWTAALRASEVDVFLPKFKAESSFSLEEALNALGMKSAFDPGRADFRGMTGPTDKPFFIGAVLHKAFVAVDEEGTEAAAATAVMMLVTTSVGPQTPVFRADHPFLFLIRDKEGNILFLGRLSDPK